MSEMHRHDLSDEARARLWPMVLRAKGKRGRRAEDGRLFFDATLWKLRTATPWRDLPPATSRQPVAIGKPWPCGSIVGATLERGKGYSMWCPASPISNG